MGVRERVVGRVMREREREIERGRESFSLTSYVIVGGPNGRWRVKCEFSTVAVH